MNSLLSSISIPDLINRVKLIILSPTQCWDVIAEEHDNPRSITIKVVLPLAVVGCLAIVLGQQIFGISIPLLGVWRPELLASLVNQIVVSAATIGSLFIGAFVIQKVAPYFQREVSYERAFATIAYSSVPTLTANIMGIIPSLLVVGLLALIYSLFVFYQGASKMVPLKNPPEGSPVSDNTLAFVATVCVSIIVVTIVILFLAQRLSPATMPNLGSNFR